MNKALQIFEFEGQHVRVLMDTKGNVWFVARDVALLLGYTNPQKAIQDHCKYMKLFKGNESLLLDEFQNFTDFIGLNFSFTEVPPRGMLIIPESDVWRLIVRSQLPKAQEIERWIMEDVLPSVRKTGTYSSVNSSAREHLLPPPCEEALSLRPSMRQKAWQDAMQAARLDGMGTEAAWEWFARLCATYAQPQTRTDRRREGWDAVHDFIDTQLVSSKGHRLFASTLYKAFRRWWADNHEGPVPGVKTFGSAMSSRYYSGKSNTIFYVDVDFKDAAASRREHREHQPSQRCE